MRSVDPGGRASTIYNMQAKVLLLPEQPASWGLAVALSGVADGTPLPELRLSSRWLNAITSYTSAGGNYRVHVNLGLLRDHQVRRTTLTWGLAYEYTPNGRFGYFTEAFKTDAGPATLQMGCRYDFDEHVSLNATLGGAWHAGAYKAVTSLGINVQ
jgi:hypothetical protein